MIIIPQMKPMNWIMLLILMNMIILMKNINNFYNFNKMLKTNMMILNKKISNWKW